jgi:hypothetical protein
MGETSGADRLRVAWLALIDQRIAYLKTHQQDWDTERFRQRIMSKFEQAGESGQVWLLRQDFTLLADLAIVGIGRIEESRVNSADD